MLQPGQLCNRSNEVIRITGSREAAFEATLGEAWSRYERHDYQIAMRRFNQAWLLNSNDSEVFRGFACVLFATGSKAESVEWDRKAAEIGNAKSQNNLAAAYFGGDGVSKDYKQAVEWYRKAAEQGHMMAQYQLGVAYEEGKGVERNLAEAVNWYQRAAQQGYIDAKKRLLKLKLKNILAPQSR